MKISHHMIDNNVETRPPAQLDSIHRRRFAFLSKKQEMEAADWASGEG
jgi:hypothetical protein